MTAEIFVPTTEPNERRNFRAVDELLDAGAEYQVIMQEDSERSEGKRQGLYRVFRRIAIATRACEASDEERLELYGASYWEGEPNRPGLEDSDGILRWATLFTLRPKSRRERQQASMFASGLDQALYLRLSIDHFGEAIKAAGGIEALARQGARRRRGESGPQQPELIALRVLCPETARTELAAGSDQAIINVAIKVSHVGAKKRYAIDRIIR